MPRSFYTGQRLGSGRGDARGRRLRRGVRPSTETRTSSSRCGCERRRSSSRYDPEALARAAIRKGPARPRSATPSRKARTTVLLARRHPERLRRAAARRPRATARGRGWRCARSCSARPAAGRPSQADSSRAPALLERLGLWREPLFYRAVLDYAFWAGVDAELRESDDEGELREPRRGTAPWPDRSSSTRIAACSAAPRTRHVHAAEGSRSRAMAADPSARRRPGGRAAGRARAGELGVPVGRVAPMPLGLRGRPAGARTGAACCGASGRRSSTPT